jgi:deoxyribodipyrimidine photo-lyase
MWFRQDLRVEDNPALLAAHASQCPLACVYVLDDETPGRWRLGEAARWWLHHSLAALGAGLARRGAKLILRRGRAEAIIPALAEEIGAAKVVWSRCYEPSAIARDTKIKAALHAAGRQAESFNAALAFEPWQLKTGAGGPFKVYSPFWRAALAQGLPRRPNAAPKKLHGADLALASDDLHSWSLMPNAPNWAAGFAPVWTPGESGARARLEAFLDKALSIYSAQRDFPGIAATSGLSPHLHFGEIGPVQIWAAVEDKLAEGGARKSADKFIAELGWREFSTHLLYHFPTLPEQNWRKDFDAFPWRTDPEGLKAWQKGRTGYPIVDAGMRELWATGTMHNRVRMITASFLIKHLLIDWREGQDWFWDTLVDADLANNAASWQWVAGSGADAAPYFRIFNPVTQGENYDPEGVYVRRWVPELARLPDKFLHRPWEADASTLARANVQLGETYPHPIVDHKLARTRALAAFEAIRAAA